MLRFHQIFCTYGISNISPKAMRMEIFASPWHLIGASSPVWSKRLDTSEYNSRGFENLERDVAVRPFIWYRSVSGWRGNTLGCCTFSISMYIVIHLMDAQQKRYKRTDENWLNLMRTILMEYFASFWTVISSLKKRNIVVGSTGKPHVWWRHAIDMLSTLLPFVSRIQVTGGFPLKGAVMRSFGVFYRFPEKRFLKTNRVADDQHTHVKSLWWY